jgi:hypothetical protein
MIYVFFSMVQIFFKRYFTTYDKLIYISSPFSHQGLPEVNEFSFIHIVYTIITAIPT